MTQNQHPMNSGSMFDDAPAEPAGLQSAVLSSFATPFLNHIYQDAADLNQGLRELVLAAKQRDGSDAHDFRGWQSGPDFLNWEQPAVKILREKLQELAVELTKVVLSPRAGKRRIQFRINGRAHVLGFGHYTLPQGRAASFWSGIYHASDNETVAAHPMSGKLELFDPRPGAAMASAEGTSLDARLAVNPVAGQVVAFPSWLEYSIHPNFSRTERVLIAFNVGVSFDG